MAIPPFRDDGHLPIGVHHATEEDVVDRFGRSTPPRSYLMSRVARWLVYARAIKCLRFVVDGSFVTAKKDPEDVDCVCWLPLDFEQQYQWGKYEAVRLQEAICRGKPEELYGAGNSTEWGDWLEFFSRTREIDGRRKGIIEVRL